MAELHSILKLLPFTREKLIYDLGIDHKGIKQN